MVKYFKLILYEKILHRIFFKLYKTEKDASPNTTLSIGLYFNHLNVVPTIIII